MQRPGQKRYEGRPAAGAWLARYCDGSRYPRIPEKCNGRTRAAGCSSRRDSASLRADRAVAADGHHYAAGEGAGARAGNARVCRHAQLASVYQRCREADGGRQCERGCCDLPSAAELANQRGLYRKALEGDGGVPFAVDFVKSWHDNPKLIAAFAGKLLPAWKR